MNPFDLAHELEQASKIAEDHGTIAARNKKAAAMLRELANELCESNYTFENGQPFVNKYAKKWKNYERK
jgi:hypothetical protein